MWSINNFIDVMKVLFKTIRSREQLSKLRNAGCQKM